MSLSLHFHLHNNGRVRQAHQFRHHHARLPGAHIVRLQSGQNQVWLLGRDRRGQKLGDAQRVDGVEVFRFHVNGPVSALGQRFANGLPGALRPGAQDHHLAAVLFFQLKGFFKRVGVGLVDLEAEAGFVDPRAGSSDAQLRIARPEPA